MIDLDDYIPLDELTLHVDKRIDGSAFDLTYVDKHYAVIFTYSNN